jgi:hypothetical protein
VYVIPSDVANLIFVSPLLDNVVKEQINYETRVLRRQPVSLQVSIEDLSTEVGSFRVYNEGFSDLCFVLDRDKGIVLWWILKLE